MYYGVADPDPILLVGCGILNGPCPGSDPSIIVHNVRFVSRSVTDPFRFGRLRLRGLDPVLV